MAAERKGAETLTELRSRVLREVGDPDGDRWLAEVFITEAAERAAEQD